MFRNEVSDGCSVFAGNSNPENRFDLGHALSNLPTDEDQRRSYLLGLWKLIYPDSGVRTDEANRRIKELTDFRRHRLQTALGAYLRLACHPGQPGLVYILESFESVQRGSDPMDAEWVTSIRHRLWKTNGEDLQLAVIDWGVEETHDWHFTYKTSIGSYGGEELTEKYFAPPRTPDLAIGARFESVIDIALASDGTLYLTDNHDHRVRAIRPDGKIYPIAGKGMVEHCEYYDETETYCHTNAPSPGNNLPVPNGSPALETVLVHPFGLGVGPQDEVFVTTSKGVMKIANAQVTQVSDEKVLDVAVSSGGVLHLAKWVGNPPLGELARSTGTALSTPGLLPYSLTFVGDRLTFLGRKAPETFSSLDHPFGGLTNAGWLSATNDPRHYFPAPETSTIVRIFATESPTAVDYVGRPRVQLPTPGQPMLTENFQFPEMEDMEVGPNGNLYFIGKNTHQVFVIENSSQGRVVRHLLGVGTDGGTAGCGEPSSSGLFVAGTAPRSPEQIHLNNPRGLAVDSTGNVYVADTANNRILKLQPDNRVYQVAGMGCNATNPFYPNKMPSYRFDQGEESHACFNQYMTCEYCVGEGQCPEECSQSPLPACVEPVTDPVVACTQDAHPWHVTELAVFQNHLYALLYERNAVLAMNLADETPQLRMFLNDPWGIENKTEDMEADFYTVTEASIHCPKYVNLRQIADIAVDADNVLHVVDYGHPDQIFSFPPASLNNIPWPETTANSALNFARPIANRSTVLGAKHPVAIAPNPSGGLYAAFSNRTEEEASGAIPFDPDDAYSEYRYYQFPIQGGEALAVLSPTETGYTAHVLADHEQGGNRDCGSGVIAGETGKENLDDALKASLSTLCRSYARTIASYPLCIDGKSGFAIPQSFSNSLLQSGGILGTGRDENKSLIGISNGVGAETAPSSSNVLQVKIPCLAD